MKNISIFLIAFIFGLGTQRYFFTSSTNHNSMETLEEIAVVEDEIDSNTDEQENKKIAFLKSRIIAHQKDNDALKQRLQESEKTIASLNKQIREEPLVSVEEDTIELRQSFANDYFEKIKIKDQLNNSFKHSIDMMAKNANDADKEKIKDLYEQYLGWDKIGKNFLSVYTDIFSASELQEISQFYSSKVGRMLTDKQEEIQQKMFKTMQDYMQSPDMLNFQKEVEKLNITNKPPQNKNKPMS